MPNLTIVNDLDEAIHVAFFVATPLKWKNHLQPGERWTTHLPTLPLYFQARYAQRTDKDSGVTYPSPEFSSEDSAKMRAIMAVACLAGTAYVAIGVFTIVTFAMGGGLVGMPLSAPLWSAAKAGGAKYVAIRSGDSTMIFGKQVCVRRLKNKVYSVRMVGAGQRGLWDVAGKKQV